MRSVGIDISKKACQTTIMAQNGTVVDRIEIPNDRTGWSRLEARLAAGDELVVDASTYACPIHDRFRTKGWTVIAVHPAGNRKTADSESKTDWKGSYDLANQHRTGYLHRAYTPGPAVLKLHDLLRAQVELGQ